jgi:IS5 family transposase
MNHKTPKKETLYEKKQYKTTEAQRKAQKKYDESDISRRRAQKRDYMRRKRLENPNYCKWK